MNEYEVSFKFETGTSITVHAADEAEAMAIAEEEMHAMSVDHLPEMWPEDYVFDDIHKVEPRGFIQPVFPPKADNERPTG